MKKFIALFKGSGMVWLIYLAFTIISILAVYSSIGLSAIENSHSTPLLMTLKHVAFVAFGWVVVFFGSRVPFTRYSKLGMMGYWISLGLLLLLLTVFHGRWIALPMGLQFQPSEIAKVCVVIFLARTIVKYKDSLDDWHSYARLLGIVILVCGFIFPENLSTAILVGATCLLMMLAGGVKKKFLIYTIVAIIAFGALFMLIAEPMGLFRSGTWSSRIDAWLNPNMDELNQENMAKMAVASGGFFKLGIGSTVQARLMTQAHNDFIYAVIVEEGGAVAGLFVLLLYTALYWCCIKIARRCKNQFGSLIVFGYGTVIYLQALINICVAVGVLPVTGQTLPFISYGGTAYIFLSFALAAIQSVARTTNKEKKKEKTAQVQQIEEQQ